MKIFKIVLKVVILLLLIPMFFALSDLYKKDNLIEGEYVDVTISKVVIEDDFAYIESNKENVIYFLYDASDENLEALNSLRKGDVVKIYSEVVDSKIITVFSIYELYINGNKVIDTKEYHNDIINSTLLLILLFVLFTFITMIVNFFVRAKKQNNLLEFVYHGKIGVLKTGIYLVGITLVPFFYLLYLEIFSRLHPLIDGSLLYVLILIFLGGASLIYIYFDEKLYLKNEVYYFKKMLEKPIEVPVSMINKVVVSKFKTGKLSKIDLYDNDGKLLHSMYEKPLEVEKNIVVRSLRLHNIEFEFKENTFNFHINQNTVMPNYEEEYKQKELENKFIEENNEKEE